MFAVRTELMRELLTQPKWKSKFEAAQSWGEIEKVVESFVRARGLKVKTVERKK